MPEPYQPVATPVADSLRRWAAWPDVLADYTQRDSAGVWTRPSDVLPGRRIRRDPPVVAAWGEMTWGAVAAERPGDPDLVWLQPVTPPAEIVDPLARYPVDALVAAILEDLRVNLTATPDPATLEEALRAALRRHVGGMVADLSATTALLLREVRRDRWLAVGLLRALADLPAGAADLLLHSPAGAALFRLARRSRPPVLRRRGRRDGGRVPPG